MPSGVPPTGWPTHAEPERTLPLLTLWTAIVLARRSRHTHLSAHLPHESHLANIVAQG